MIDVKVIASGSSGNCTCLTTSEGEKILCDVGVPLKKIFSELDFMNPDYAIVTHEHGDHAHLPAIKTLLERGTQVYMTEGTKKALKLDNRHNLHTFKAGWTEPPLTIGSCKMEALGAQHDAAEPIVFYISDEDDKVLYLTDTRQEAHWFSKRPYTKIIIETNFSVDALENSAIEHSRKERILKTHLSIETAVGFFEYIRDHKDGNRLDALKEIHLIHISKRHGNGEEFKAAIQKVVGDIPIYVSKP